MHIYIYKITIIVIWLFLFYFGKINLYKIIFQQWNDLIPRDQHVFLAKRSTTINLLECLNYWTKIIDHKKSCDVIYVIYAIYVTSYMAKAFDTILHRKLLYKLRLRWIGSMMMNWMENFLCTRLFMY